jgi:hypothetical protein
MDRPARAAGRTDGGHCGLLFIPGEGARSTQGIELEQVRVPRAEIGWVGALL